VFGNLRPDGDDRPPENRNTKSGRRGAVKRLLLLTALATVSVLAAPFPGSARFEHRLQGQFHDGDCTAHAQCGTGLVEGYGHVTTTLDLTGAVFDPATGCLTSMNAVRNLALVDDPGSTLTLSLSSGVICDNKGAATFTISGATGRFAGHVVLPGSVRATLIPGVPGDSAQYPSDVLRRSHGDP
jgi:hypothetical protein